jgi:NAD(P)-dependent dehydrogenase (short-subunit alcohol dehydrogenase family)
VFQSRLGFDVDDAEFNRCLDVNLTGMWRMARAAVPCLKGRGGRIVNIASVGGRRGTDFGPAYCASKAGVISLTQSLALALGAEGITVNAVCPGGVATEMMDHMGRLMAAAPTTNAQQFPAPVLPGELTAEDIGHAVVFFASDLARKITRQALNVDGGIMMN